MPASAFESTPWESCVSIALSVSSSLQPPFRPSTPLDSHTFKICSRKYFRIRYFQKIPQLYQNKALQPPQNHTLSACGFITPLESHTFKKEGMGGCHSDFGLPTSDFQRPLCHGSRGTDNRRGPLAVTHMACAARGFWLHSPRPRRNIP